jgi:tetratricopeptide (TPR) repeat protein
MILASIYFGDNQLDSAISVMNKANLIDPQNPAVANNLSWLYLETGTNLNDAYELAISAFEKDQDNPSYAHTLGWALYKKGFFKKAEWQFRETLRLIDKSKQGLENKQLKAIDSYHLALTLLKSQCEAEAKEILTFAIETGLPSKYEKHAHKILESIQVN